MCEWRMVKEIPFSAGLVARFYTLFEDKRDAMCDSVRPEWGIADRAKNHMVKVVDYRNIAVFSQEVTKDEGNAMYREMKPLDRYGYGTAQCYEWLRNHGADLSRIA